MTIDFNQLVLGPCMGTFAETNEVLVTPWPATTDSGPAYTTRGIYSSGPIDVALQEGGIFSDQRTSLGIKLDEWPDIELNYRVDVKVKGVGVVRYWVGDIDTDGQGGATLTLRTTVPDESL